MESENFEDITKTLNQIDIEDEPGAEKNDIHSPQSRIYKYVPKQIFPRQLPDYIDFDLYVKENCENKITILNRKTFQEIKRPIVIFFHHFREKCNYLTKWLDEMYELSLKYGERIEFIAADMSDMDIIYPGSNPISFYCRIVRPEDETPRTYAIDEKKRIHEHFDAYNTMENLCELCENFLSGNLYPSQPLPENNEGNLVKICVHHNYEELVLNSSRNIFLIVSLSQYMEYEPNFENVALALKDYNLDIVYMEAEKNYIPFEYCANSYPTILFIPFDDKKNFIYYEGYRTEENIIEFLKNCLEQTDYLKSLQEAQSSRRLAKTAKVSPDFSLDFNDLPQFLHKHYDSHITLLNRQTLEKTKQFALIAFMNFQGKCSAQQVDWLNKIYKVAETCYSFTIFVADFKEIDVINPKWKPEDLGATAQVKPKIYAFDRLKNIYEFNNFTTPASLFYFTDSLQNGDLFYSEVYKRYMDDELLKDWTANYLKIFVKKSKKHIFITFYSSDNENTQQLSDILLEIAQDVKDLNVEVVKFDVKFNYVSLEFVQDNYPVHYFIPKNNKSDARLYVDNNLCVVKMLEFIRNNVGVDNV